MLEDSGIASFLDSEDSGNNKLAFIVWEDSIVCCGGFARTDNLHDLMFWRIRCAAALVGRPWYLYLGQAR